MADRTMAKELPKPAKTPCPSCPYRKDVPSGVWSADEYEKLPRYDGETWQQAMSGAVGLFMCHQQNGCLCSGWLACHDTENLLALRFEAVHPSAYGYVSPVPVFASGADAAAHGMAKIGKPSAAAHAIIDKITIQKMQRSATRDRP